ncbi:2506_t:CDS:1, partial [Gigaspora margarita]
KNEEIENLKKELECTNKKYQQNQKIIEALVKNKEDFKKQIKQNQKANIDYDDIKKELELIKTDKEKYEKENKELKEKNNKLTNQLTNINTNFRKIIDIIIKIPADIKKELGLNPQIIEANNSVAFLESLVNQYFSV